MPSIIVCKPQVPFSGRLKDSQLQRLTVTQLRKKARDQGLDVSRLTQKWEFVHVLVEQRKHNVKPHIENVIDTKRRTIFDIPGEIRNIMYSYALTETIPIVACYGGFSDPHHQLTVHCDHTAKNVLQDSESNTTTRPNHAVKKQREAVKQLRNMSWANRELRKEARSYFFAHNQFHIQGSESSSHAKFLLDIGADGRAKITNVDLDADAFWMYNMIHPLLPTCTNLRRVRIRMHLGHVLDDVSYDLIRCYLIGKNNAWLTHSPAVVELRLLHIFTMLPALQTLQLVCAIPGWVTLRGTLGYKLIAVVATVESVVRLALEYTLRGTGAKGVVECSGGAPELGRDTE
jgi:hypothetical protein